MEALLETPDARSSVGRSWYLVWWALCASAAVGGVLPGFGGRGMLLVGMGLFCAAAVELLRARTLLSRGERAFVLLVLVCFAGAQTVQRPWLRSPAAGWRGVDFSAYYIAAKALPAPLPGGLYQLPMYADGRVNLNAEAPPGSSWAVAAKRWGAPFAAPFIYPPLLAVLLRPLAALSFGHAYVVWCAVMLGCTVLGVALAGRTGRMLHGYMVPLAGVAFFSYYPMLDGLLFGQCDNLIFVLLASCFFLLTCGRSGLSALCFAAAALVKLTPLLALPVFIFHRKWRWLLAYAAWTAVLTGLSIFGAGWEVNRQFWVDVLPHLGCGAPIVSNTSVVAFVQDWSLGRV